MERRSGPRTEIAAKATARLEAVAKASYRRTKTTTEVIPPDVSRAKAGAWLTIISPITEWAGLRGDALNFKRRLLRIQQEETLLRIAQSVRKKLTGARISQPVPRKILIPALEKASLEESSDKIMIDRWANLLASASLQLAVQPRFVSILEELSGSQAECLEHIAFHDFQKFRFPCACFSDSPYEYAEHNATQELRDLVADNLKSKKDIDKTLNAIIEHLFSPGVFMELVIVQECRKDSEMAVYDSVGETGIRRESDLSILESLGLIRRVVINVEVRARSERAPNLEAKVFYYHLTNLGVGFCEVCSRPTVLKLERVDEANRA